MTARLPPASDQATPAGTTNDTAERFGRPAAGWRRQLYHVIFESDTTAGRAFDLVLVAAILVSVTVVVLDSIDSIRAAYGTLFDTLEWVFTLLFTAEYIARLACVRRPARYARSAFGIIDLVALLPTYLAVLVPGLHSLVDVRVLRLLRLFRILKLAAYVDEFGALGEALAASRRKILVFVTFVMMVVLVMGTLMYVVEGPRHGFTSIPTSVYWAITTMTTVGFGDLTPKTDLGRTIASVMMLLGWGTLAVPTGIVSAEFSARRTLTSDAAASARRCAVCDCPGHAASARFCRDCGAALPARTSGAADTTVHESDNAPPPA